MGVQLFDGQGERQELPPKNPSEYQVQNFVVQAIGSFTPPPKEQDKGEKKTTDK